MQQQETNTNGLEHMENYYGWILDVMTSIPRGKWTDTQKGTYRAAREIFWHLTYPDVSGAQVRLWLNQTMEKMAARTADDYESATVEEMVYRDMIDHAIIALTSFLQAEQEKHNG